ncbi:hypothetical protein SGRIM128S_04836 [Streptomyces griseomycini]
MLGPGEGAQHQRTEVLAGGLAVRGGDRREPVVRLALALVADGEVVPGELGRGEARRERRLGLDLLDLLRVGDEPGPHALVAVLPPLRQVVLGEAEIGVREEGLAVLAQVEVVEVHDAEVAGVTGDPQLVLDRLQRVEVLVPGPAELRLHPGLLERLEVDDERHGVGADGDGDLLAVDLTVRQHAVAEVVQAQIPGVRLRLEVQQDTALVVLTQEADRILENVRRIPAGGLGLELLPERLVVGEFRLDLDLRELLLEERDRLLDGDGARLAAPPRVTECDRPVSGTAAAATRGGRRTEPRDGQRGAPSL